VAGLLARSADGGTILYRVMGPIDQAGWISAGVDGTKLPLTTISGGCSLRTAVFLSPVTRSIATEHKVRRAPRMAAIIRRSIEGVTDVALGYPPRPTRAAFPSAQMLAMDESGRGCASSTKDLLGNRDYMAMLTNCQARERASRTRHARSPPPRRIAPYALVGLTSLGAPKKFLRRPWPPVINQVGAAVSTRPPLACPACELLSPFGRKSDATELQGRRYDR